MGLHQKVRLRPRRARETRARKAAVSIHRGGDPLAVLDGQNAYSPDTNQRRVVDEGQTDCTNAVSLSREVARDGGAIAAPRHTSPRNSTKERMPWKRRGTRSAEPRMARPGAGSCSWLLWLRTAGTAAPARHSPGARPRRAHRRSRRRQTMELLVLRRRLPRALREPADRTPRCPPQEAWVGHPWTRVRPTLRRRTRPRRRRRVRSPRGGFHEERSVHRHHG